MASDHLRHRQQVLAPGSIIGILGGGQLGRMLAVAASRLGLITHIFTRIRLPRSARRAAGQCRRF